MLWAGAGDAHAKLGDPEMAATAYAFSTKSFALTGVFDAYARLVLEYNLKGHYAICLKSLAEAQHRNRTTSTFMRALSHSAWFIRNPWDYVKSWRECSQRDLRRQQLEARLAELEED